MSMMVNPYKIGVATPVAPSVIASDRTVQNTSGLTVTVNSGTPAAGELVILFLNYGTNLLIGTTITWPSGFTQGDRRNGPAACGAWAWKIAGGSEPSTYTVSWASGSTRSILSMIRVRDHNGFDASFQNFQNSNGNYPDSGPTTGTTFPGLRLYLYGGGWGGGVFTISSIPSTSPAISTVLGATITSVGNSSDGTASFVLAKEELTTTLARFIITTSWTLNSSGLHWSCFTIPIKRA